MLVGLPFPKDSEGVIKKFAKKPNSEVWTFFQGNSKVIFFKKKKNMEHNKKHFPFINSDNIFKRYFACSDNASAD